MSNVVLLHPKGNDISHSTSIGYSEYCILEGLHRTGRISLGDAVIEANLIGELVANSCVNRAWHINP